VDRKTEMFVGFLFSEVLGILRPNDYPGDGCGFEERCCSVVGGG
jgi:hypothetical protein